MRINFFSSAMCVATVATLLVSFGFGQTGLEAVPSCTFRAQHGECLLTIDRLRPQVPGVVRVWNGTRVIVRVVNKSPFESCDVVDVAQDRITSDPLRGVVDRANEIRMTLQTEFGSRDDRLQAESISTAVADISSSQRRSADALIRATNEVASQAQFLRAFLDTQYGASPFTSYGSLGLGSGKQMHSQESFDRDLNFAVEQTIGLLTSASQVIKKVAVESAVGRERLAGLSREYAAEAQRSAVQASLVDAVALDGAIERAQKAVQVITTVVAALGSAKQPKFEARLPLAGSQDEERIMPLQCNQIVTGNTTLGPLPITIKYRNIPLLVASGGLVFSSIPSRSFTVQAAPAPVNSAGNVYQIATNRMVPQVIPFVFLSIRLREFKFKTKSYAISLAPGLGINPNGFTRAEFALMPSTSIGNVYFSFGGHFGRTVRLTNGYHSGDLVPSGFTAPTGQFWTSGLALAISYRFFPVR